MNRYIKTRALREHKPPTTRTFQPKITCNCNRWHDRGTYTDSVSRSLHRREDLFDDMSPSQILATPLSLRTLMSLATPLSLTSDDCTVPGDTPLHHCPSGRQLSLATPVSKSTERAQTSADAKISALLSVTLTRLYSVSKRVIISSNFSYGRLATPFYFCVSNLLAIFRRGFP